MSSQPNQPAIAPGAEPRTIQDGVTYDAHRNKWDGLAQVWRKWDGQAWTEQWDTSRQAWIHYNPNLQAWVHHSEQYLVDHRGYHYDPKINQWRDRGKRIPGHPNYGKAVEPYIENPLVVQDLSGKWYKAVPKSKTTDLSDFQLQCRYKRLICKGCSRAYSHRALMTGGSHPGQCSEGSPVSEQHLSLYLDKRYILAEEIEHWPTAQ